MNTVTNATDTPVTQDSFSKSAGRQLLIYGLMSIAGVGLLMVTLSWASSLTGASAGSQVAVDAKLNMITLTLREEPPQLNSTLQTDTVSGMVIGHLMEGLLRYDHNNDLAPGVAERYENTGTTATFWLRDSLWSDGQPVTAHDFVFAWRTAVDPANASEYAFILFPVQNAEEINRGEMPVDALGVTAIDDHTLEVQLARPTAYFDKLMAFSTYYPIREDFYNQTNGRYGADADELLYNGPFILSRWVHGANLRMEKNLNYWDADRIKLDVIEFPYITSDQNALVNLFTDKKIAYTTLGAESLETALEKRWHLDRFMDGSVFYIEFNFRQERLTHNYHLRKAMQLAIDPAELVYKVTKIPGYLPAESIFPVWLRGVDDFFRQEYPAPKVTVDLEAAKRHLEIAKRELGLTEIPPLVLLTGDNPVSNIQSEYYQGALKKHLGLDVKIDKQIFKQRLAKMTSGDFDMVLAGWGPDYDDPLTFGDLFASWNLNNRGRYNNPELDRQVHIAQNQIDPRTRMEAFAEIQRIIIEDVVVLLSYERGLVYVTDPRLKGMVRRQAGADPDFTNAYIVDAAN
ncbi:MAG: peptide ABC transporter substrate-binding protein [Gammaproteobacteria bacterium]|nr:peptide ABC transporter substrate-binding protein [Gammaproteobacteria bacterium]